MFLEHVDCYKHVCKVIRADYDSMYRDGFVTNLLLKRGVKLKMSAPYHHQANVVAERSVPKLLDLARRTLMIEARAPLKYTDLYIEMIYISLNRLPKSRSGDKTPFEIVTGKLPDLSYCVPPISTTKANLEGNHSSKKCYYSQAMH
jgi:hypothetical protein